MRSLCFLMVLSSASMVSAQDFGVVTGWDDGGPICTPVPYTGCGTDLECPVDGEGCEDGRCVADDALLCVTDPSGQVCPNGDSPRAGGLCFDGPGPVCDPSPGTGLFPRECFTAPDRAGTGGPRYVRRDYGDCDGDLIPNLPDDEPCEPERAIGRIDTARVECVHAIPCQRGDGYACEASAECDAIAEPGPVCVDTRREIYCCGGNESGRPLGCPDPNAMCAADEDGFGFCLDFPYCMDWPNGRRLHCLKYENAYVDDVEMGDCDEDGLTNAMDPLPCEDPVAEEDAGAGTTTPPPPGAAPRFGGGAGCACRVGHADVGPVGALALLGLALSWARRRSRRGRRARG